MSFLFRYQLPQAPTIVTKWLSCHGSKKIGICQLRSQFSSQTGPMRLRCAGFGAALQDFEGFKAPEAII